MRPRFRFLYAAVAAFATYGLLFSLNAPRMGGTAWGHGPGGHGWHHHGQQHGCMADSTR